MKRFHLLPEKVHGLHTGVLIDNGKLSAAQFLTPGTARRLASFRKAELVTLEKLQSEIKYASDLA